MLTSSLVWYALISGLLLSLNPVAISIFSKMLIGTFGNERGRRGVVAAASIDLASLWSLLALITAILFSVFGFFENNTLQYISLGVSFAAIVCGLLYIKDYYWYGKRAHAPAHLARVLHRHITKQTSPLRAAWLAVLTTYATLPSLGVATMCFAAILALSRTTTVLPLYVFVTALCGTLIGIAAAALANVRLSAIVRWENDSKAVFRLCMGLTLVMLGWTILLIVNGTVVF